MSNTISNKRIAKNTALLYIRTLFVMLISFYTSRVILQILGVDDFGIYQVVGGLVSIFTVISGALTISISRFITFEIGTGNRTKLRSIFSTSVTIQIVMALAILMLAEYPAIWFIKNKMTIPAHQVNTAIWVLQFSLVAFGINLISIPYTACIIAHERMTAYAYISIVDVCLRLGICYLITLIPLGKLMSYAALMMLVAITVRVIYTIYCKRNFEECKGRFIFDRSLFKEMMIFSGWSFFSNSASIINSQGITMLMNVYFGLTVNTARGLALQVENGVLQFVNNFTTAINPQITKSYAAGERDEMYVLVCRGAKFSCYAMFIFAIPLVFEMEPVLKIWLGKVPPYTVIFAQLSLIMGLFDCMGSSGYTACMATGKLKKYALVITSIAYLEFIGTWILYYFGAPAVTTYYLFILVKASVNIARMFLLQSMVGLPVRMYIKSVIFPTLSVAGASVILPLVVSCLMKESVLRILCIVSISLICTISAIYMLGMTKPEKEMVSRKILAKLQFVHR